MRYALLIYASEQDWASQTEEESQAVNQEYMAFTKDIVDRGLMKGGEALQPTSTATSVRLRNGDTLTTDGPFAETKDQLGGFYLVDCKDLDEAVEVAAGIPDARRGTIEVRPVMEVDMPS
ncbi:MAG: YciI family protein [Actinomycetota bacterium]